MQYYILYQYVYFLVGPRYEVRAKTNIQKLPTNTEYIDLIVGIIVVFPKIKSIATRHAMKNILSQWFLLVQDAWLAV